MFNLIISGKKVASYKTVERAHLALQNADKTAAKPKFGKVTGSAYVEWTPEEFDNVIPGIEPPRHDK